MEHQLSKTLLITNVIELIASKYRISVSEARDKLYNSRIIDLIDDDETGLYGESPLYVLSLFEQEIKYKTPVFFKILRFCWCFLML